MPKQRAKTPRFAVTKAHPEMGDLQDQQMDADREWFESHPFANQRFRPPFEVETAEFEMLGFKNVKKVRVTQIAPGLRTRTPVL